VEEKDNMAVKQENIEGVNEQIDSCGTERQWAAKPEIH
jgi:hypothetical protein